MTATDWPNASPLPSPTANAWLDVTGAERAGILGVYLLAVSPPLGVTTVPYQDINATLADQDLQEVKQAIATIQKKLPFLVTLNAIERKRLFKMGDKRLAFVQTSLNAAQSNRNILPASFDLDGFSNDYRLAISLMDIEMQLNQLSEQVDDTLLAVGSEAMISSLTGLRLNEIDSALNEVDSGVNNQHSMLRL